MGIEAITSDAYDLLHQGALVLNRAQAIGMRIDEAHLRHQERVLTRKRAQAEARFMDTEVAKLWRRHYGDAFTLGSDPQLRYVLFKLLGLESGEKTKKGNTSVKRGALEELKVPGLDALVEWRKIDKTLGTYITGLLKEQTDGVLRPFFHLGSARTYRSSSSAFNFQNLPTRDPEQGRPVRQAILPWEGQRIVEADFGGLEVRIAACYHQDPVMLKYLNGHGDMHRDAACELFGLAPEQVTKDVRFYAKNGWVFPQFYGSYWGQCAPNLWGFIPRHNLTTKEGEPLKEHLRAKLGIRTLSQFKEHLKKCENVLWNERFTVYRDWKKRHLAQYQKRGYIELLTGFRCSGTMARNDVINYPVQGAAFHCLLWTLIQLDGLMQREARETRIIGQIHDSAVTSAPSKEAADLVNDMIRISTKDLPQAWRWIIVPLEIEVEATGVDESWYGKTLVMERPGGGDCGHKWWRKSALVPDGMECLTCGNEEPPF